MNVSIRRFEKKDIPLKVEWINNPENNQYLHYDIPICIEKTVAWYYSHLDDDKRLDCVIEVDGLPVGTIGLLSIDRKNKKAEYYIAMGETSYKGKGIAKEASKLILEHGFNSLGLNRIYLFTETENTTAQKLFESLGFNREGLVRQDIVSHGKYTDRFLYGVLRKEWFNDDHSGYR